MNLRYLCFFLLLFSTSSVFSWTPSPIDEVTKIAEKQVKDLDEMLILVDPNTALSEVQIQLITKLFVEKIRTTRDIKNSDSLNKQELIEQLMKEIMHKLHYEILSKNQREAKFEYQKNYESN